jgi:hypothetical protein
MKKLFVIFLLVSLVPFTVGCNGLWDFDDDDDPVLRSASTVKVTPKATLPDSAVTGTSIRAQQDWEDVAIWYDKDKDDNKDDGEMFFPNTDIQPTSQTINGTIYWTITFNEIDVSNETFTSGYALVTFKLQVAGQEIEYDATVSNLTSGTVAAPTVTVKVTDEDNDGTLEITVIDSQGSENTNQTAADNNYITSIKYGTNKVSIDSTNPTEVKTLNPIFNIYFDSEVNAINSWAVKVTNTDSNNSFELNSTDANEAALFEVTPSAKLVTVKVKGGTGYQLKNGANYKIEFLGGQVNSDTIAAANTRYIKTAANTYPTTTLTDYTGKNADVPVLDPQVITLTFSGDVDQEPTGTVTLERYDTSARTATPTILTIDANTADYSFNGNVVEVSFTDSFTAGKYYTVKNETGVWLDANGNQIEGVTSIDFATAQ